MYFINKIKEKFGDEKLCIFVDMDGVITDYDMGSIIDFKSKRPILTNINTIKQLSVMDNVELYILSICKKDYQRKEKNEWLDKYAPFFKKDNRFIISKESNPKLSSKELKCNFLSKFIKENKNKKVVLIDDDNDILGYIYQKIDNIVLYQDSSIID